MKKVITYGTYDLFHQGHYNILKRAKEYGDYLIVGVTSESFDIERGKIGVRDSLATRIENVRKTGFADEIIIEEFQGQKIQDVQKYGIDALVIGSDWYGKFDYLKPYCEVVYLERTKDISSTQLRLKQQFLQFGIITDNLDDGGIVLETKFVSGIHLDRVYSSKKSVADAFCSKYELNMSYNNLENFMSDIDVVIINTDIIDRYKYVKESLLAGKHVICSCPITQDIEELKELIEIAKDKKVILLESLFLAYMQSFNQMMWMVESNCIGNCISVKYGISNSEIPHMPEELIEQYATYVVYRLCGNDPFNKMSINHKKEKDQFYYNIVLQYADMFIDIELGMSVNSGLTIRGEKGILHIPDDWWNTGYFEMNDIETGMKKRYCYNYEGNGMRYILRELLILLREKQNLPIRMSYDTCINLLKLHKQIFKGDNL